MILLVVMCFYLTVVSASASPDRTQRQTMLFHADLPSPGETELVPLRGQLKWQDVEGDMVYTILGHPYDEFGSKRQLDSYNKMAVFLRRYGIPEKSCTLNTDMPGDSTDEEKQKKMKQKDPMQVETPKDDGPKARWKQKKKWDAKKERQLFSEPDERPGNDEDREVPGFFEEPDLDEGMEEESRPSYFGNGEWLRDYGEQQLQMTYDKPRNLQMQHFDQASVMAYEWQDCVPSIDQQSLMCFTVLQIRNYKGAYPSNVTQHAMDHVIRWVRIKTRQYSNQLILVAFQAFDRELQPIVTRLVQQFQKDKPPVMAVLFTLMERQSDLQKRNICVNEQTHKIPVIAMSDLDEDEYLMLQFNARQMQPLRRVLVGRSSRTDHNQHQVREIKFMRWLCF